MTATEYRWVQEQAVDEALADGWGLVPDRFPATDAHRSTQYVSNGIRFVWMRRARR